MSAFEERAQSNKTIFSSKKDAFFIMLYYIGVKKFGLIKASVMYFSTIFGILLLVDLLIEISKW